MLHLDDDAHLRLTPSKSSVPSTSTSTSTSTLDPAVDNKHSKIHFEVPKSKTSLHREGDETGATTASQTPQLHRFNTLFLSGNYISHSRLRTVVDLVYGSSGRLIFGVKDRLLPFEFIEIITSSFDMPIGHTVEIGIRPRFAQAGSNDRVVCDMSSLKGPKDDSDRSRNTHPFSLSPPSPPSSHFQPHLSHIVCSEKARYKDSLARYDAALNAIRGISNKGLLVASTWMGKELLDMEADVSRTYDGDGKPSACHLSVILPFSLSLLILSSLSLLSLFSLFSLTLCFSMSLIRCRWGLMSILRIILTIRIHRPLSGCV